MIKTKVVFEITPEGDLQGLYTDKVDLFAIGKITNVNKASNVEFDEESQLWQVLSLDGRVLHTDSNRETAIEWEIENFSPGKPYYCPEKHRKGSKIT